MSRYPHPYPPRRSHTQGHYPYSSEYYEDSSPYYDDSLGIYSPDPYSSTHPRYPGVIPGRHGPRCGLGRTHRRPSVSTLGLRPSDYLPLGGHSYDRNGLPIRGPPVPDPRAMIACRWPPRSDGRHGSYGGYGARDFERGHYR
ncbi:hypothetical protein MMC20_007287 [Loxospora ochrophaea]|nr:hypothetical protein [Loxospora ochrophaea]